MLYIKCSFDGENLCTLQAYLKVTVSMFVYSRRISWRIIECYGGQYMESNCMLYVLVIPWFVCMYDARMYVHVQIHGITDLSHLHARKSSTS